MQRKVAIGCVAAISLCGAGSAAGQSNGGWHRNTWNETPVGVLHAYFLVPPNHSYDMNTARLKLSTHTSSTANSNLRLTCNLHVGRIPPKRTWIRRPAWYRVNGRFHTVAFPTPSRLLYSAPAAAICHTSAHIDNAWFSLRLRSGDPHHQYWIKLRHT